MKKVMGYMLVIALLAGGCASIDSVARKRLHFINYSETMYPPAAKDYPVELFFQGQPQKPFEVIGEIVGSADTGEIVRPMLEARVRQLGGDAAIEISTSAKTAIGSQIVDQTVVGPRGFVTDVPVSQTYSYDVIRLSAKVIKYK